MDLCHHPHEHCDLSRISQLNEARKRVSKMEEQMRWWAECTAQWRHRWSTVRHERNNAREESSAMRAKILQAQTVIEDLENEKRDLKKQLMDAKRELHKINVTNLTKEECIIKIEEKAEKEAQTEEFQESVGGNDINKDLETIVTQLKAQLEEEKRLRISEKQEKVQLEAEVKKLNDDVSSLQILLDKIDEEKDRAQESSRVSPESEDEDHQSMVDNQ